jgi:ABC-type sugar transport system substrate-binding protein
MQDWGLDWPILSAYNPSSKVFTRLGSPDRTAGPDGTLGSRIGVEPDAGSTQERSRAGAAVSETENDHDLQAEGPREDDASTSQHDVKQRIASHADVLAASGRDHEENLRRIARAVAAILVSTRDQRATTADQSDADERISHRRPGSHAE